jgi:GH35 family endo-1,4-beta-xylanase
VNTLPNSEPSNVKREFNERWPYDRVKKTYEQVIRQTMQRFQGRCPVAEIMNEAHDKANLWGLNHEQILDMAKAAFRAAREGSPTVQRMMNHCCMWGEYAKNRNGDGSRRWSPHQFIKACFDNGIDYEVIGLQLYYPQHDVFEIDRMLDRFIEFNRSIHITEISHLLPGRPRPGEHAPEDLRARLARAVVADDAGRLVRGDVDAAVQQAELQGRRVVGFRGRAREILAVRRAAAARPSAEGIVQPAAQAQARLGTGEGLIPCVTVMFPRS